MAYRTADHTRMQQMDFIVGQEIKLSNAHQEYDICNQLQGKYPKEFFYKGWHPHCYCPVTFILKTVDELKIETEQILNQEPTTSQSVNQVTQMPDGFKKWVKENKERVLQANTTPYFIADNYVKGIIDNKMTYVSLQEDKAAQNAQDAIKQNATIQDAIKKEAAKAKAIADAEKIAKAKAIADAEAIKVAAQLKAEQDALALITKQEIEAELAAAKLELEAAKAEQEKQDKETELEHKAIERGGKKLKEAEDAGLDNTQQYLALIDAVYAFPTVIKTIQYRIVQMNIKIKEMKDSQKEFEAAMKLKAEQDALSKAAKLKADQDAAIKQAAKDKLIAAKAAKAVKLAQAQGAIDAQKIAEAEALVLQKAQEAKAAAAKLATPEVLKAQEKAAKKIAEAESYGITGKKMDGLTLASTGQNAKTIQYQIDQMNIAIKEAKAAGITPGAKSIAPIVQAQKQANVAKAVKAAKPTAAMLKDPLSKEALLQEFSQQEVDSLFAAHEKFLDAQVTYASLETKIKKLKYEITHVTTNPNYSTSLKLAELFKKDLAKYELELVAKTKQGIIDAKAQAAADKFQAQLDKLQAAKDKKEQAAWLKANKGKGKKIDESQFTQARKDAALWAKSDKKADDEFRPDTVALWKTATPGQKAGGWAYTGGSGSFNRPLRGYDGAWGSKYFKGIGNVSLNNEGSATEIKDLTDLINKSISKKDTWLQRGIDDKGLDGFLGNIDLSGMDAKKLGALIGKQVTDTAFLSCGSAKGKGFSGNILNIYCPKGTKMIYAEPFSAYGGAKHGQAWDGKSKATLDDELETIIQRGSTYRITKIEKRGSSYNGFYIDIEVVSQ